MHDFLKTIDSYKQADKISATIYNNKEARIGLSGLHGSAAALLAAQTIKQHPGLHLFICQDKEKAGFFYNDLERLFGEHCSACRSAEQNFWRNEKHCGSNNS